MIRFAISAVAVALSSPAFAQADPAPYAAPDYTQDATWLCRPGRADACAAPLATTIVAANGATSTTDVASAKAPATDCFYVYPTVSTDPTPNSDMVENRAETNVAVAQFAAFRSVCRPFAPLYRQVTLAALRDVMLGKASTADRIMAYRDVVAAWADYLKRDNRGRGVGGVEGAYPERDRKQAGRRADDRCLSDGHQCAGAGGQGHRR